MPNNPFNSADPGVTANLPHDVSYVSSETLGKGFEFIEKSKNATIDAAVDYSTKYLIKLVPGGELAQLAVGAIAKEPTQSLKDALHETTKLQRPPMILDRQIHYPGDVKEPIDLFDPKAREKFINELEKPTTPDDLVINLPKPNPTKPQALALMTCNHPCGQCITSCNKLYRK